MIRNLAITLLLSLIGSFLIISWLFTEEPTKAFLYTSTNNDLPPAGIKNYSMEFRDKSILLNIELNKSMSCEEVVEVLGIENITIKEHIYAPQCSIINPRFIVITYKEVTLV